jgi:hypothetical protein
MPLVEFAGVSGVGKTTLLKLLFQTELLHRWKTDIGPNLLSPALFVETPEKLTGIHRMLWNSRVGQVAGQEQPEDFRKFQLDLALWHLRDDQSFTHHQSGPFTAIDEHLLQLLFPQLLWLVQSHPEEARIFLKFRNFVLLMDNPENILKRVRHRQITGTWHSYLNGRDDASICADANKFQTALLGFLKDHEYLGYNWFAIDMSKGLEAALPKATAFLLGLENMFQTGPSQNSA